MQALFADPRWPSVRMRLLERREAIVRRISTVPLEHGEMCRLAGEIRGLDYVLRAPDELRASDPRSEV